MPNNYSENTTRSFLIICLIGVFLVLLGFFILASFFSDSSPLNENELEKKKGLIKTEESTPIWLSKYNSKIVFSANDGQRYRLGLVTIHEGIFTYLSPTLDGDCITPVFSPSGDKVFFAYYNNGHYQLASWTPNSNNVTILTNDNQDNFAPTISQEGDKIVWGRVPAMKLENANKTEIFVSQLPDFKATQLTHNDKMDAYSAFLPDDRGIIVESCNTSQKYCGLIRIDWLGNETPIVYNTDKTGNGIPNIWGDFLLFEGTTEYYPDAYAVFIVNWKSKEKNPVQLSDTFHNCNPSPRFSPDGKKIAYYSPSANSNAMQIVIKNIDINSEQPITNFSECVTTGIVNDIIKLPRWDHTGSLIAAEDTTDKTLFLSDLKGQIYKIPFTKGYRTQRFLEIYNFDIY